MLMMTQRSRLKYGYSSRGDYLCLGVINAPQGGEVFFTDGFLVTRSCFSLLPNIVRLMYTPKMKIVAVVLVQRLKFV